jgi:hypothetical protein
MDLALCFVADSVNLWTKLLPRSSRSLIENRLNPIVVLLKQRLNLLLLFSGQPKVFRKVSEFLVDRLRRVDLLKLLTRRALLSALIEKRLILRGGQTDCNASNDAFPQMPQLDVV